jgi:uncharacterized protein YcnI
LGFNVRFFLVLFGMALSSAAGAHVTVWPKESVAAAHEKYSVRVPNEKSADTVAVELRIPDGVRAVSFEEKPGWTVVPQRDAKGAVVSVRWQGRLAPQRFVELGLIAVNPDAPGELVWTAVQTYADNSTVEWSGTPGSPAPAARTAIVPAPAEDSPRHAH